MTVILRPGAGILFMKVGTHAQEPLAEIIARKRTEIDEAGYALWGYGGNTCHPQHMVQPFAKSYEKRGETIYLLMQEMESKHFALPLRADELSVDALKWEAIPSKINVRGSRYALVIKQLRHQELDLPLAHTQVAIGNSQGRPGHRYISGRVDKACLEVSGSFVEPVPEAEPSVRVSLVAELASPYAVYVRNRT